MTLLSHEFQLPVIAARGVGVAFCPSVVATRQRRRHVMKVLVFSILLRFQLKLGQVNGGSAGVFAAFTVTGPPVDSLFIVFVE